MKRYPAYKPSGVSWIGEVPEHWEIQKLKHLFVGFSNGTSIEQLKVGDSQYPVSRIETISKGVIDKSRVGYVEFSPKLSNYSLNPNDILISHINSYERIGNHAVIMEADLPLYHGMNLLRLIPREGTNVKLAHYFLLSSFFIKEMQKICKPAINQVSVPSNKIKSIELPIPPLSEQEAIVAFLDSKTSKIDSYVAERERVTHA